MQTKSATPVSTRSSFASTAGGFVTGPVRSPSAKQTPRAQVSTIRR